MHLFYDQSSASTAIYHNAYFTVDDVQVVLAPLFENFYGRRKLRSMIEKVEHRWCAYDRRTNRYTAAALVDSQPADNTLYIRLFGVQEASQGQGIGTRLLKAIRRWAQKHGYFAILLHTQIDNTKAIGLYEKVGFQKQYYAKNFYRRSLLLSFLDNSQPDAYQMILYL